MSESFQEHSPIKTGGQSDPNVPQSITSVSFQTSQ